MDRIPVLDKIPAGLLTLGVGAIVVLGVALAIGLFVRG